MHALPREVAAPAAAESVSPEEIASLVMKHRAELYAFLFAALLNHHDAEDLLQEVSIVATRCAGQFQRGTNFRAWAREIARRRILEFVRQRNGSRFVFAEPEVLERLAEIAECTDTACPDQTRGEVLRGCLEKLNGVSRRAMELKYAERLDADQIAARLRRTATAVYSILKRTREVVRRCADKRLVEMHALDGIQGRQSS